MLQNNLKKAPWLVLAAIVASQQLAFAQDTVADINIGLTGITAAIIVALITSGLGLMGLWWAARAVVKALSFGRRG